MRVLILGGTTEASLAARAIADAGIDGVYSYAGRTAAPSGQPLPLRVGGFGGAEGLADWMRAERISHVIDATHPFAARISANAVAACHRVATPLLAFERPPWRPAPGDRWTRVPDIPAAVAALPLAPTRVFLAIGRQNLADFAAARQHDYLLRLVDPPDAPLPLPRARVVVARGPFDVAADTALMRDHGTAIVVAKNAGGTGAVAKIEAARALDLDVIMVERPAVPSRPVAASVAVVIEWLHATPPARRGA
ncbi:MAG: cobalt-precorrin-6A reductase [Paracoccaceae bacterium]|nr:MAG: cobalt-precorrin-6A reductase [Paracoccaceae bacterium]